MQMNNLAVGLDWRKLMTGTATVAPRLSSWEDHGRSLVQSLPKFLSWNAGTALVSSATEIHENWMHRRLYTWSQKTGADFVEMIAHLPKASQQRLFHAPEFFFLLRSKQEPGQKELEKFQRFVHLEEYLCGQKSSAPSGEWSALGDYYAPKHDSSASPDPEAPPSSNAQFLRGILIDAWSPNFQTSWMPPVLGTIVRHTPEEVRTIIEQIQNAMCRIESVSPAIARTIEQCVYVIGIATGAADSNVTASISARRVIGRVTLGNLLSDRWSLIGLCEAIVHETIHSVIYRLELCSPLYTDISASVELKGISPWSGRTLALHSMIHACFVWFGLWNFAGLIPPDDEDAAQLRLRCQSGFMSGDLLSNLSPEANAAIQPEVRCAIQEMFETVRRGA